MNNDDYDLLDDYDDDEDGDEEGHSSWKFSDEQDDFDYESWYKTVRWIDSPWFEGQNFRQKAEQISELIPITTCADDKDLIILDDEEYYRLIDALEEDLRNGIDFYHEKYVDFLDRHGIYWEFFGNEDE